MLQISKELCSPNFNDRKDGKTPRYIILHYTDTKDTAEALRYLCDPKRAVSAHYVIEENGNILQLVEEDKRAWHAGESYWQGETDMNSASIGIEFVNPGRTYGLAESSKAQAPSIDTESSGHSNGLKPFPKEQIASGVALCKIIMEKWNIPAANILAHSDIAPTRKQDPGHLFPWEALAQEGVGIWPKPTKAEYIAAEEYILHNSCLERKELPCLQGGAAGMAELPPSSQVELPSSSQAELPLPSQIESGAFSQDSHYVKYNKAFSEIFYTIGYDPNAPLDDIITAFHRHYAPEKFKEDANPAMPDSETIAKLRALI